MNLILGIGRGGRARRDRVQPAGDAVSLIPPVLARVGILRRPRAAAPELDGSDGLDRQGVADGPGGLARRPRPARRRALDLGRRPAWRRALDLGRLLDWRRGLDGRRGPDRRPDLARRRGLDWRRMAVWYAVFAGYAALVAVFTRHADQAWGIWAAVGYLLAAITAVLCRGRGRDAALFVGLAGALAGPLAWLAVRSPATSDVQVVGRAGMLLLRHGSPYLTSAQLSAWRSYDPYLPAMTVFGLVRGAGVSGVLGDPRLWLAVVSAALLAVAFGVAAPHRIWSCAGCRHEVLRYAAFAVTAPMLALPLALGITDPPVIALFCVALACVGTLSAAGDPATRPHGPRWPGILRRIQPSRLVVAGLAIGVACAMKLTAWPAVPVIAVMIAARDGGRAAWRFVAVSAVTAGAAIAATAPAALAKPAVFLQNTILYPLGLTRHLTPAASPLPGHLLAATGTAGHWAAIGLLAAAGLAVAAWLIWRPPANARAAAWRLAVGLCVMFVLSPATRWGYFTYPLGLLGWLALTSRAHPAADGSAAAPEPVASVPAQGEPAPAAMAGLLPLCGSGPRDPADRALGIDLDTA